MENYNPFKLWGSYAGGIIGAIVGSWDWWNSTSCFYSDICPSINFPAFITFLFLGFFLGWGIHSIFRFLGTGEVQER